MSQDRQLQLVTSVMITAGFEVSERFSIRPRSFDLMARKNGTLLIIKVVAHIDSVSEDVAFDLEVISRHLGESPLSWENAPATQSWNAVRCMSGMAFMRSVPQRSTTIL